MRRSTRKATRRSTRHGVRIECQVVRERDFQLVADRIVNLSATGLMVSPADPALTGERLIVSFQIPHSGHWVDAEATVARVVHGRRPGEHTRGLALELENVEEIPQMLLGRALRRCPPAPPGHRSGRRGVTALSALLG
ncbi:MAG TPA: PilZ domain-containing protein [Polyangiaceae bacterium]|nr:PilZ domain-containing protein [Polyangiaceae bacterium]